MFSKQKKLWKFCCSAVWVLSAGGTSIWASAASVCVNDEWAASRQAEEEEAGGHSLPDKLLHNAG